MRVRYLLPFVLLTSGAVIGDRPAGLASQSVVGPQFKPEPPPVVTNGILVHLDANDPDSYPGSGTTWTGLSGTSRDATLVNGPTYTADSGLNFDGVNDYARISHDAALNAEQLTVFVRAYRSDWSTLTGNKKFISKSQLGGYNLSVNVNSSDLVEMNVNRFSQNIYASSPRSTLSPGWHSFAGTYDRLSLKLYIDGVLVANTDARVGGNDYPIGYQHANALQIAAEADTGATPSAGFYLEARLSAVLLYNRALTAAEIFQNHAHFR